MPNTITDKTTKPVLIRDNGEYIIPITDSLYVQYHNSNLGGTYNSGGSPVNWTVANVEEALDVIANKPMIGDVFEVIFTVNASTGAITADKTFTELETAWTAKKLIVGKIISSSTNTSRWGNSTLDTIKPNLLSCTYGDYKGSPAFWFSTITATGDDVWAVDIRYEDVGTISVYDAATKRISLEGHTHSNYAPLASPTFTGTPKAPTATAGTNNTQIATTAFVNTAYNSIKSLYVTFTKSGASTTCSSTAQAIYTAYNTNKQPVYATYNGSIMPLKDVTRTGTSSANYKWTANFQNLTYTANTTSGLITGSSVNYNELSFANSYLSHPIGNGNDLWITGADIIYTGEDRYQTITGGSINQQIDSLDAKKEIRMKYVHKFASNGQITFNSGQFWGNRVYCCSTNDNTWAAISKITLANGCLVTTAQLDIYVDCPLGIGQSLPVEQGPAIKYILIFYAAGNITWSIASNYIKWENGVAPTTAAGDYCMLTIFNRIASLQKVNLS